LLLHWFQALLLGLVQGITEFFPVSSSAHLKFTRFLLGLPDGEQWIYFDLLCHLGTWLALCWYLRKEIFQVLRSPRQIALFASALAPLVPAYFLLKPLRLSLSAPQFTGYFLLATSLLLFSASRKKVLVPAGSPTFLPPKFSNVVCVGMMQSLALLPGLSRSGSTIAAGRFCGWSWTESARFSFLLAVPTILGGEMLESLKLLKSSPAITLPLNCYAVGFASSLLVGLISVRFVFKIYERANVKPFVWYTAAFGLLLIAVFHG
jgi:undecaprenyl-diphosphatase